ncbi:MULTISPECIES: ATP-binding protein [unclassified Streptomyces]|uniref:ATP-binding protein n=1 Tax=unclassified Streptomyces TaxID=2593676 RepID=UPI002DD93321|nr:ATP-binding protein [Streptomyces sp. NBC_00243]WRZ18942.1 ATP-binding protein [Streptomyces sp. NBC_00243]
MNTPRMRTLTFVPADPKGFQDRYLMAQIDAPELTLGELLGEHPALSLEPLRPELLQLRLDSVLLRAIAEPEAGRPLYLVPGTTVSGLGANGAREAATDDAVSAPVDTVNTAPPEETPLPAAGHPERLSERQAVLAAHDVDINTAATYLSSGLSVLVRCEKLLVEHLAGEIAGRSGRPQRMVRAAGTGTAAGDPMRQLAPDRRGALMTALQTEVAQVQPGDVVVIPHLDLLAGGSDAALSAEARELTDVVYERSGTVLLAFTDPSLVIPEVLASRFDVRLAMDILPRLVPVAGGGTAPIGRALVTRDEAELFEGFEAVELYKHVAGMNPVRLRHALHYAFGRHRAALAPAGRPDSARPQFGDLLHELRVFKVRTSSSFEIPNVPMEKIGGYRLVKDELERALEIITGAVSDRYGLSPQLAHDLIPRGFIFHGPPGTGKTLFAKAVASKLGGTIQVVSGPEVTDMYVGESERKIRELFAEARRNAPAVLVFDEFDSIAARRSGREDGGSRAGNAIVAQLLTELDGFRPDVPVLIIGTTNRIDLIDDALLRPSRFRPVKIDLPDEEARRAIAAVHAEHFEVTATEALLDAIARATEGMNGDEVRSLFRDARADQLVGPGQRVPDARRLGELIGELRRARQQRELDKAQPIGRSPEGGRPALSLVVTRRRGGVVGGPPTGAVQVGENVPDETVGNVPDDTDSTDDASDEETAS